MRRNLEKSGLSLSQAQSISNLCNQRASDISAKLSRINNYGKTLKYGDQTLTETAPNPLPTNVKDLLMEKSRLHACQAFLMEHIKLKDALIKASQKSVFTTEIKEPVSPVLKQAVVLQLVDEPWGWNQLTNAEKNEYLESESHAAHIGQFIHKGSVLDNLRTELPHIKTLEWAEIKKDEKVPLTISVHHTSEQLLAIHEELAAEHRKHEQRVNFFKAKVKNLVTTENARIANVNADAQNEVNTYNEGVRKEYQLIFQEYHAALLKQRHEFEKKRQEDVKEIAALRIAVDARFQPVVDIYLKQVTEQ
jgi:hypothetical protein